jgi:spermidine synthase
MAVIGIVWERDKKIDIGIGLILVLISGLLAWLMPAFGSAPETGLIALAQSPYAEIRVVDMERKRHLVIDGGVHTIVDPLSWESRFPYTVVLDLTQNFFETPGNLLLIGLGGGSIVKRFYRQGWTVEAVEIDPVVVTMAREHFGLRESEGTIHSMDGRQFLLTHQERYDVIIMDAFGSSSIPFHLVTQESFGLIESRLTERGIFALNLESDGWNGTMVRSLSATLKEQFGYVLALPAYEPVDAVDVGNVVLFAAHYPFELPEEFDREFPTTEERTQIFAWDNRFEADTDGAPLLTDDLNPVDIWSEKINLTARKELHHYFQPSGLSW